MNVATVKISWTSLVMLLEWYRRIFGYCLTVTGWLNGLNLHITAWQIQCDAFARISTVFHVAQETEGGVQQCDDRHANIQHTEP